MVLKCYLYPHNIQWSSHVYLDQFVVYLYKLIMRNDRRGLQTYFIQYIIYFSFFIYHLLFNNSLRFFWIVCFLQVRPRTTSTTLNISPTF